ncbi:AraC family transcriptional regulator [Bradyrhizobium japonicum]|uniref:AraC family transcriptional regulator n=1 Tax=Bradyrhizobium japonicum TaxID=375 RepID=A0A0A3XM98_BRAJP|nr:helix-turn-helix domain-containing protein [Bradyrhizobium japonicum]KGT74301.1 AraC family transcriptional regulator [Bradyrhizobium japonicum]MCS3891058.1 AraC-like DNA-binding protein [Bradyrhizobium japonicum USDA 38]MCS3943574.1 AraC-like DNA-binding protein [Bradyrhizobium japonicum]WLB53756.1 helix-turn-helix domain-containing protein [Bradyrhizobium japonicum]WLB64371.1 helix-turn-helix domain-containing protein [Bradyrhizobium japonicum]
MEQVTSRPRHVIWNTAVTPPDEQFSYYREAICQAFMNLTPESATTSRFPAKVEAIKIGTGAINRVVFPEHTVHRSRADIAASTESCFYLNFKLAGRCRMLQGDSEVSLSRGQVGIVDSDREVTLLHDRGPMLEVASFWVPSRALRDRLPPSFDFRAERVSDDPHVGHLIVETARSLNAGALRMAEEDSIRLFDVLLDLVALSLSRRSRAQTAEAAGFADATALALRRAVHERMREPGLTVANVARAIGISERYVHKLFERAGTTFSDYVMDRRLDGAARDLSDPAKVGQAIGSIAFDWGFSDLSHFARRFKQRFGCRPRDWRAR